MKGAYIKRIDQFIVDRLIQMGYKRVKMFLRVGILTTLRH